MYLLVTFSMCTTYYSRYYYYYYYYYYLLLLRRYYVLLLRTTYYSTSVYVRAHKKRVNFQLVVCSFGAVFLRITYYITDIAISFCCFNLSYDTTDLCPWLVRRPWDMGSSRLSLSVKIIYQTYKDPDIKGFFHIRNIIYKSKYKRIGINLAISVRKQEADTIFVQRGVGNPQKEPMLIVFFIWDACRRCSWYNSSWALILFSGSYFMRKCL